MSHYLQGAGNGGVYNSRNLNLFSYSYQHPINLSDPDGNLPILPFLAKAGAGGAADFLMQTAFAYYFDPNVSNFTQAVDQVSWLQVGRSAAEGLLPWKVPGGALGRAAATAVGDVSVNAASAAWNGQDYSGDQAMRDFMVGMLGDLAGGGLGKLVDRYGGGAVRNVLNSLDMDVGFSSFSAFKREFGNARAGYQWHHVVEQRSSGRFGAERIHNTSNLIEVDVATHQRISNYYSSKQDFTGGQTVRKWLDGQSFEQQMEFGMTTLRNFGVVD